jgi:hypothetical protein
MKLTEVQILKFQQIYFDNFGLKISVEDAIEQGVALCRLLKSVERPVEQENENEHGKNTRIQT